MGLSLRHIVVSALLLAPASAWAQACTAPSILVSVTGFKDRTGNVRVELYPAVDGDFLAPRGRLREEGKTFLRLDNPAPAEGDARVCVPLPAAGDYAIAVLHDRNANSKLDVFSDGFGFANNPKLGFSKPDVAEATVSAGEGETQLTVVLNYWNGLGARPLRKQR